MEWWLFVLFILVKLLTITVYAFFPLHYDIKFFTPDREIDVDDVTDISNLDISTFSITDTSGGQFVSHEGIIHRVVSVSAQT